MSIAVPLYGFGTSGGSPNKSTIIVTAPTGSTVTCKMGSTTKTATEKNGVWTFGGLDLGTWTITSKKGGDSATQDVAITRLTVEYVTIVYRITPEFTYTGDYAIVDDSDNPISDFASWKGNWKIRFLTSGTLTFTNLNGAEGGIDVFLVGGGGDGAQDYDGAGGGGGGYTTTEKAYRINTNVAYTIVIGASSGSSTVFGFIANAGKNASKNNGGNGGSGGGSGVGKGGSNGSNGGSYGSGYNAGIGQGTTTREFAENDGKLYSGGGGGGPGGVTQPAAGGAGGGGNGSSTNGSAGETNTGGGGGGGRSSGGKGGSGIIIIRNKR